jgi:RNA-directed DNA polymerase
MAAKLKSVKAGLMGKRHLPVPEQGKWLASVVRGNQAYYAVPGNTKAVGVFRYQVTVLWQRSLSRRSQKGKVGWDRMRRVAGYYLPPVKTRHPWPEVRFAARYSRQEPSAGIPLAGICAGGRPQGRSLPRPLLGWRICAEMVAWPGERGRWGDTRCGLG